MLGTEAVPLRQLNLVCSRADFLPLKVAERNIETLLNTKRIVCEILKLSRSVRPVKVPSSADRQRRLPELRRPELWRHRIAKQSGNRGFRDYCFVRLIDAVFATGPINMLRDVISAVPVSDVPDTVPWNVSSSDPIGN